MKIIFEYQGKRYTSKETDEMSAEATAEAMYNNFNQMNKFIMHLDDGSHLIIGEAALKSGVLLVVP